MPKLNQIVAVVQGKKSRTQRLLTEVHRGWAPEAISGIIKYYTPKDEEGDRHPSEQKRVHLDVAAKIGDVADHLEDFWDVVATQEYGNTMASADVVVGDFVVASSVPIPVLLFLEKQLTDLHTFVQQLPVLPADREWTWDANRSCYATAPATTLKTQKTPTVLVKCEATKEHPAQTDVYNKDVIVGEYATTYLCSAIPADSIKAAITRIEQLQDAVKKARETANSCEVEAKKIGADVLSFAIGALTNRVQS